MVRSSTRRIIYEQVLSQNKATTQEYSYRNETIDSLPTEILLPLLKAAAGNQVSSVAKLKLVCRRFNGIIRAKRDEFPMVIIQRLKFSQELEERNETIFDHFARKSLPIYVAILKTEDPTKRSNSGRFLKLDEYPDLYDLPLASFLGPNDAKLANLMRHFKMIGGRLTFWGMKVNDKLILELLELDLSAVEELKFYQVKLTASACLLKSLLEKMYNLQELKMHYCRFPPALISDELLSTLANFKSLTITENLCGELLEFPNLTLSNNQSDIGRRIVRCGPELKIT